MAEAGGQGGHMPPGGIEGAAGQRRHATLLLAPPVLEAIDAPDYNIPIHPNWSLVKKICFE